ncbi:MAG TPA: hypothetical protein PLU54_10915, partial [Deltaproteobacteria bacterium]|nr:hypothetical protein [Deltaproteobacteria bacterium]
MAQRVPVLSSKLMPPRTEGALERVISRHLSREIPARKVTTVTAGAGYGKTTLVAQAVLGHDAVWYRLDSTDRDLATFMHHMIAGIGRIYPGFGRQIAGLLHEGQSLNLDPRGIITVFLQEMEDRLTRDVIFILDDFHSVADSPPIRQALTFFMENLSPLVHLVIISRSEVPLPLSRLRAMREVLDVRPQDLLFSIDEIRHLAQQSFRVSLTEESTGILHEKTAGWVSALILFFHSLHRKTPHAIEQDIHAIKGSSRIISDYLDENVFAHLNREIRDFLIRTSILTRLHAPFCDRFLGISNSSGILMHLEKSHLFTFALDEDNQEYCYHQLFQEFLLNALRQELGVDGTRLLHGKAARILEQDGSDEEAVHHYLMAGTFDEACAILDRLCLRLIGENRFVFIKSCIDNLPGHCFDSHPWMEYLRSCLHAALGRYQDARKGIRRAMALFREHRDQIGIDHCLKEIAFGHFMIGEFQKAQEIYEKLLDSPSLTPMLHLEAHIQMVFINAQIGNMDVADAHAGEALRMLDDMEDSLTRDGYHAWLMINHGFRYVFSGDPLKAMEMAKKATAVLERLPSHRLMTYCHHLASSACLFQGHFRQGLDEALQGLAIMNRSRFHDTTRGWLLCNAGANALCLGLFDEAMRYTEDSLRFFQNGNNPFGMAYAYFTLQQFHLVTGRLELAEETGKTCLQVVRGLPIPHVTGPAKASLADTLILKGRLDEARELIEDARGAF